jgi:hypothetical protein
MTTKPSGRIIYCDSNGGPILRTVTGEDVARLERRLEIAAAIVREVGYRSRLYERIYEAYGWQRVEREQKTNGKTTATECLWLSPNTQAALRREAAPLLEASDYDLPIFTR